MKIYFDKGIVIQQNEKKLFLDPSRKIRDKNENVLVGITHAHSDHLKKHDAEMLMTSETRDLAGFYSKTSAYNEEVEFGDLTITQHNANHILGSSQFEVRNGKSVVYTGDIRLNEGFLFEQCPVVNSDVLIIESTYGMPHFKFPSSKKVFQSIKEWVEEKQEKKMNVVFGSYSLGKSQELIKVLNLIGLTPFVSSKIAEYSKVYVNNGVKLKYENYGEVTKEGLFLITEAKEKMNSDSFVAIAPPHLINKHLLRKFSFNGKETSAALLTGWGSLYSFASKGIERVFPLSDHADFNQLINYVEQAEPNQVFTVHGYAKEFAKQIKNKLGIPAYPLKNI